MSDKEEVDECVEGARKLSTEELLKPLPTDDGGESYRDSTRGAPDVYPEPYGEGVAACTCSEGVDGS